MAYEEKSFVVKIFLTDFWVAEATDFVVRWFNL